MCENCKIHGIIKNNILYPCSDCAIKYNWLFNDKICLGYYNKKENSYLSLAEDFYFKKNIKKQNLDIEKYIPQQSYNHYFELCNNNDIF